MITRDTPSQHEDKLSQKKSPAAEKPDENQIRGTHCGIPGHTILECNKLKTALAAAQQTQTQVPPTRPIPLNKGIGEGPKKSTAITHANSDDENDHDHFLILHIHITDLPATFNKLFFNLVNLGTSLAAGGACTISDTEVILGTRADTSVMENHHSVRTTQHSDSKIRWPGQILIHIQNR